MKEKDEILAMKVSQLGLKPTESNLEPLPEGGAEQSEEDLANDGIRFAKLNEIDEEFANYKISHPELFPSIGRMMINSLRRGRSFP